MTPFDIVKHYMGDEAFNVYKRTSRSTGDIGELLARDHLARSVQAGNQQGVKALKRLKD